MSKLEIRSGNRKYIETFPEAVDITDVLELVDNELFQILRERKQLGLVGMIRPGAMHTRFDHSIGTYGKMLKTIPILAQKNPKEFTDELILALKISALYHDLGHSPFSHQTEPIIKELIGKDHKKATAEYIGRTLRGTIKKIGGNPDLVLELILGNHPMHEIFDNNPLGSDKLDYIERDSHYLHITGAPDITKIINHLIYIDGTFGIEERAIREVIDLQNRYFKLHHEGYLSKPSLINQRMLQRALQESIAMNDFDPRRLWEMTDGELFTYLKHSKSKITSDLHGRLKSGINSLLKSAVVFKKEGHEQVEIVGTKPIKVYGLEDSCVDGFVDKYKNPLSLKKVEDEIAELVNLNPGDILIASVSYFSRLKPEDVNIFSGEKSEFYSLLASHKEEKRTFERMYRDAFCIRIAVVPEQRQRVFEAAEEIKSYLKEEIKTNCSKK